MTPGKASELSEKSSMPLSEQYRDLVCVPIYLQEKYRRKQKKAKALEKKYTFSDVRPQSLPVLSAQNIRMIELYL